MSLPQNSENSMQINLFNLRLAQFQRDNYAFLKVTCNALRSDQVEEDGVTPSALCIDAYISALKEINTPDSPKLKASSSSASAATFHVSAIMPVKSDLMGKVIGKGGNVIKKISDVNDVRMTVGKWCEKDLEKKTEINVLFDGVLIKGDSMDVKKAMDMVNDILSDFSRDEPYEKKKKF